MENLTSGKIGRCYSIAGRRTRYNASYREERGVAKMSQEILFNRYNGVKNVSKILILVVTSFIIIANTALCDEISELKAQIQKIQEENKILQEQLNKQGEIVNQLLEKTKTLEEKDEILSKETKDIKELSGNFVFKEENESLSLNPIPKLDIKGFSDIGFSTSFSDDGDNNTFVLGAVDLFITSEINERVSFLAETVFESDTDTNETEFELERVSLKYSLSDLFNVRVGRMHTPLGYWNQAYHHGTWLQTTILRPEIYLFEDDGGILPVHSVGIELSGEKEFDDFGLGYSCSILNGRGRSVDEIQVVEDKNDSKAINALISLRPHFIEGLILGVDIYNDVIPPIPEVSTRSKQIDERILGGYTAYIHDRLELLGEFFNIYHDDDTSGEDFETDGFYLQGAYKIDKLAPYCRFDSLDFGNGDPYFTPDDIDIKRYTLGIRWDIFFWNALKFEYSRSDRKNMDDEDLFSVNSSFAF